MFQLESQYKPAWDQPKAIKEILESFSNWDNLVTLLGATGTGKTFTMANIIKEIKKPTLIISHNKTLAAQLATEFKYFFPKNAVHYFVSYFDYYQPEAYLPEKDIYIEKESTINQEIEMFRLGTMASLLSRKDVVVVSSVSALYGIWKKDVFERNMMKFNVWDTYEVDDIKKALLKMQYKPAMWKIEPGMFDIKWEIIDIYSSIDKIMYRLIFNEDELEYIQIKDLLTFKDLGVIDSAVIWPASQFLQDMDEVDKILKMIQEEMESWVKTLKKQGKELEANRIKKRVLYDVRMIKETWFTNGIENYSRYFDKRAEWEPPNTLIDYFPDDFLMIVDESHMSIPQLRAMPKWDASRKVSLIEHWFRLPSAKDHRPINFEEFECLTWWRDANLQLDKWDDIDQIIAENYVDVKYDLIKNRIKSNAKTLFVSATPAKYELELSNRVVEQIIRPTGLVDPKTYVYPKSGDYELLEKSMERLLKKKPYMDKYIDWYEEESDFNEIFN